MQILLETERLILRRFTTADEDNLFELDQDPEVMRFLSGGTPTPREVIRTEVLPRFCRYDEHQPAYGFFAAIEKTSGGFIGWFAFRLSAKGEVALGFRLRRAVWGRGYATEGARALVRLGFTELGAERVVATTYEDNHASRRVLEKVGLRIERRFRMTPADLAATGTFDATAGELFDGEDLEYVLTRSDWE